MTIGQGGDRRRTARFAVDAYGITSVRIRPGHHATIVNVSAAGALLESSYRMLPGTIVDVQMDSATERVSVRAQVVRCAVAQVRPSTIFYRAAVAFDRHLPWTTDAEGYAVPTANLRPGRAERADATRAVL